MLVEHIYIPLIAFAMYTFPLTGETAPLMSCAVFHSFTDKFCLENYSFISLFFVLFHLSNVWENVS